MSISQNSVVKLSLIFVVGLIFGSSVGFAADQKVAVVDIPKAIQATKEGKKIKKQLEDEYNKRKSDLDKKVKDIGKMQADFEKKSLVLSDEARLKKQQEIEGEKAKYMELREKNMQDLAKKDRELSQPMIKKLNDAISVIAKKQGYSIILHKNEQVLVWASAEADITDEVITALGK